MPFVWLVAHWYGAIGVLLGQAFGGVVFAIVSLVCGFLYIRRVERKVLSAQAEESAVLPCSMNLMSSECSQVGQLAEEAELIEKCHSEAITAR
ncbi:hypothetical protein GZ77_09350 [Endozoicomonas montiporae]|uniref:Uncharacterized protein n=2 Tax=Endozoicomonas montiporae TaxID=1027273 RepID=A0A081N7W0_9GAMM|nr:hypothetical protein [Endozoicomonas montiporae]AMO55595.1 MATE efflux family protein [Endozoicomonas montiporae CL-33]KEQ14533.1 hypothetical protein GZ77_09350 [Endozoicomonas montiporae]